MRRGGNTNNSVISTSYSGSQQTIRYSDGSAATNTAISSAALWAKDHISRTTTYSYANGGANTVVDVVSPTFSIPAFSPAVYPANWTLTGTVIPPAVSAKNAVHGDGYIAIVENGSSSSPFQQTTLSPLSITDPNSYVRSSTTTYNLTWGLPDKNGPGYANVFPGASNTLAAPKSYAGVSVAGQATAGPTLLQPSADVLTAWNNGWTGKGSTILLIDDYAQRAGCTSANRNCHGVMTMMNTDFIAPGAMKYGLDFGLSAGAIDALGANLTSPKSINIINMSFLYAASWNCNNGACVTPTSGDYQAGITATQPSHTSLINILNGVTSIANLTNLGSSVITASAGNDNLDSKYNLTALALSSNTNAASRLLIVGALDKNGTLASPASKAFYSNYAGNVKGISDRFVLAYGNMPWTAGSVKINGDNFNVAKGTSFAAPLVAGYAAILMQKFPNINAATTSNIILDTARTDTLSCHPSCDPAIYGKGEASLSRALAPVGRLR